jgi:hypothetical protein
MLVAGAWVVWTNSDLLWIAGETGMRNGGIGDEMQINPLLAIHIRTNAFYRLTIVTNNSLN